MPLKHAWRADNLNNTGIIYASTSMQKAKNSPVAFEIKKTFRKCQPSDLEAE
jgi:hypothetical protein